MKVHRLIAIGLSSMKVRYACGVSIHIGDGPCHAGWGKWKGVTCKRCLDKKPKRSKKL